jgi:hypothetical protein
MAATTILSRALLLKLVENEISSGLLFVVIAKSAYRASRLSNASVALSKAEAIHLNVANLAQSLYPQEHLAIVHQLRELRAAIDLLMKNNVS